MNELALFDVESAPPGNQRQRERWAFPGNDLVIGYDRHGRTVVLPYEDRARHVYVPGRTGTGKSRLLRSMTGQDIARHAETGCGTVVFDMHGELNGSQLAALACDARSRDLPIVVIDFTDRNCAVRWNPLGRLPNVDSLVAARRFAEAVMHASGGLDLNQAPTLQRTTTTFFHAGIEMGLSIGDLLSLADPASRAMREEAARAVNDVRTRYDLSRMNSLSKSALEDELLAVTNRLSGLTSSPLLRSMMSAGDGGFRWTDALEGGWLVLVNLATSGGTLTETDARMIAALMMTELWQAAQSRGKGAAGERRPYYVYVDEAPFIAPPTIALGLSQARGFGLHFTIAAQATSQFEDFCGPFGRAIKKAVLRDTLTKIVLAQTAEEDDIEPIARELALTYYDPLRKKHVTTTHQVVGERKEEYWTISSTKTIGGAKGSSSAQAHSKQESRSSHWGSTETEGGGFGMTYTHSTSDGVVTPEMLAAETHPERKTHVDTEGEAFSDHSHWASGTNEGGAEMEGEAETTARGKTKQRSWSKAETRQQHYRWAPIIEAVENPIFLTFDEYLHIWEKKLFTLFPRHALVSRQGAAAVEIATPTVTDPEYVDPRWVADLLRALEVKHGFRLTLPASTESAAVAHTKPVTRLASYGHRAVADAEAGR